MVAKNARRLYRYVYNPHGERILPGHWGRNCNSILSDFYWKILNVEPDDFFIEKQLPIMEAMEGIRDKEKIAVVQTTGGDPIFRTYKYMADVCRGLEDLGYYTIQLGGAQDYPGWAELDLRGKLKTQYKRSTNVQNNRNNTGKRRK